MIVIIATLLAPASADPPVSPPPASCPSSAPSVKDKLLDLAQASRERKEWRELINMLEPRAETLDDAGLLLLAEAYEAQDRPANAANLLSNVLKKHEAAPLRLALIDLTIRRAQYGLALQYIAEGRRAAGPTAELDYRAAVAYYRMGAALGRTRVLRLPGSRAGQFVAAGLLLERRGNEDEFLCCPPESAMYCVRRALDAGLDMPEAHCLYARLWIEAEQPEIAFAIVKNHEERWLERGTPDLTTAMIEIALVCDRPDEALRYARHQATQTPERRGAILFDVYVAAARCYNLRGDATMWREMLRRAVALRSEETGVMLQLADACWETGEREQADLWYRRVLEREPTHMERRRILERLGE